MKQGSADSVITDREKKEKQLEDDMIYQLTALEEE